MTQREGSTSGGVAKAAPRPAALPGLPASPAARAEPGARPPQWDEFFRSLAPARQQELLALARRQGILYAHQLPAASNGALADQARALLGKVLAGRTEELTPLDLAPLEPFDTALDAAQREAVARAVQTPDLFLLQGLPGTGKSRVVAEVITQATARGERVLLLAPSAPALDRALEGVCRHEHVFAVRCLERGESPESLRPAVRALTMAERLRALREQTLPAAQEMVRAHEARLARLRQDESLWKHLEELARRAEQLDLQAEELRRRHAEVPADVRREADGESANGTFAEAVLRCEATRKEALAKLAVLAEEQQRARPDHERDRDELNRQRERMQPLAEAKEQGRWWTVSWWRAMAGGITVARWQDLASRTRSVEQALAALDQAAASAAAAREEAERSAQEERQRLLEAETTRRRNELEDLAAAVRQEQALLESKWHAHRGSLGPDSPPPERMRLEAVEAARTGWRGELERLTEEQAFAHHWAAHLAESADALTERLPGCVNLVAATLTALPADPVFGHASFDLLILEEAGHVTESELLALARRAKRWVLVGEVGEPGEGEPAPRDAEPEAKHGPARAAAERRRGGGPSPAAFVPAPAPVFRRLWQRLHCDLSGQPHAWVQEDHRLVCRLRAVPAHQRGTLEVEHVADFPDVELRILGGSPNPSLAEIAFPSSMSIGDAKKYIYRELQELPLRAAEAGPQWVEEPQRLVLRLADEGHADPVAVPLEDGVCEVVSRAAANGEAPHGPWYTCRVEFDRAAGWHRRRAEEWLARHTGFRDLGRTARLTVPYRHSAEVARFAADLLSQARPYSTFPQTVAVAGLLTDGQPSVEFVAVPALQRDRSVRGRERKSGDVAALLAQMRGGAGLELFLDDPRHRDRMPTEVRAALPNHGLVNYLEAQAVVRELAELAANRAGADQLAGAAAALGAGPTVAVLALYPAQALLVRHLIRQTPELAAAPFRIDVDVPTAYRQREAPVVLLSLTRSHTHRAVPFGDGPQALALALTRARAKLVVFGDPGTLVRRTQWEEPLEHLDAAAAARERDLLTRLLRYLQGQGPHPHVFRLREGSTA